FRSCVEDAAIVWFSCVFVRSKTTHPVVVEEKCVSVCLKVIYFMLAILSGNDHIHVCYEMLQQSVCDNK
ncbi:hypothetical protein CVS40_4297, partial [Lucilia cuprina]